MKIHSLCVDQEKGRYIAYSADNPRMYAAESYSSEEEAIGMLIISMCRSVGSFLVDGLVMGIDREATNIEMQFPEEKPCH